MHRFIRLKYLPMPFWFHQPWLWPMYCILRTRRWESVDALTSRHGGEEEGATVADVGENKVGPGLPPEGDELHQVGENDTSGRCTRLAAVHPHPPNASYLIYIPSTFSKKSLLSWRVFEFVRTYVLHNSAFWRFPCFFSIFISFRCLVSSLGRI